MAMMATGLAPHLQQRQEEGADELETVFCCQRCRCVLFSAEQLTEQHAANRHGFTYRRQAKERAAAAIAAAPLELAMMDAAQDENSVKLSSLPPPQQQQAEQQQQEEQAKARDCSSLFLSEPNQWMKECTTGEAMGKLNCPSCSSRVGSFAWAGSQCSCGTWIVPALQFPASKLDTRRRLPGTLPEHAQSVPEPLEQPEAELGQEPATGDQQEQQEQQEQEHEDDETEKAVASLPPRVAAHVRWMEHVVLGDSSFAREVLDKGECSLTTVQGNAFDGYEDVAAALDKSCAKLAGRVTVREGPVALPAPSTSTRVIFDVEGSKATFGETIVWAPDKEATAQHVLRVKNPRESFLQG